MMATSTAGPTASRAGRLGGILLGAAALLYLLMAMDGHLYWHDVRYLYATSHYSLSDLLHGEWNPQYGSDLDGPTSGAFYLTKIALLAALKGLWQLAPPAAGGASVAAAISLLLGLAAALLLIRLLGEEPAESPGLPWGAAALLLVSPTLPWLGGKLVAEALALPLALFCLLAARAAFRAETRSHRWLPLALAILAFLAAISARVNISVLVAGFFAAQALVTASRRERSRAWRLSLAAVVIQVLWLGALFGGTGVGWTGFAGYFRDFASGTRGSLVSIIGSLAAFGTLTPLALVSLAGPRTRRQRFLLAWLALTLLPTLAVVSLYQVEARYLVAPLVPLAGLAWLGLDRLAGALGWTSGARGRRGLLAVVLAAAVVLPNAVCLSVLPYEVDGPALRGLMRGRELTTPGATLLVPWAYSDFHYLVSLWPDRAIAFVHRPRRDGRLMDYSVAWRDRLRRWYGARFVDSRDDLEPALGGGPVYYLAWERHPPLERWANRLRRAGLAELSERVLSLAGPSHGDQSWVVEEADLELVPVSHGGQYTLYRVESTATPTAAAGDDQGL
jgi:hypothetical protein